ncbi:MAG: DNA polymerase III subunit delta [Firmicutes bacterium]|nr:DNA polymerase III subunit delta [Bacillota bacterium]
MRKASSPKTEHKTETKSLTFPEILAGKKIPDKNLYVISGSDPFAFSELERIFTAKFLSDDPSLFNRVRIDCTANTKAAVISAACEEYPFGSAHRLIIVSYAHKMKSEEGEKLRKYLDDPAPSSVIVIFEDEEELKSAGSSKFYPSRVLRAEIKKHGLYIPCTMGFYEIKNWIKSRFDEERKDIEQHAVNLLQEMIGNNMWDLNQEIEKIILYVGDRNNVRSKDVETITSGRPQSKMYNLTERIGMGDISSSMKIYDELIREKTPPIMILGSLNSHFSLLYNINRLLAQGENGDNIAKKLKKHQFFIKKCVPQAQRLTELSFETIFDLLARADGGLKSGLDERNVMELTLIQICRQR